MSDWIRATPGGIRFDVRLTPAAGSNEISGLVEDAAGRRHLKARVTAIAEKNKANIALVALIARILKVAKGSVRIAAGETSRIKTIEIKGETEQLAEQVRALAGAAG